MFKFQNVLLMCAGAIYFQGSFSEIVLTPPILNTNLGYFQMLLSVSPTNATVTCSIVEAKSSADATTIENSPPCTTGSSPAVAEWIYTFDNSVLNASLSVALSTRLVQLLMVSCCDDVSSDTTSRVLVDIQPNVALNTSLPAPVIVYPNPAYVNIAPCPCNLTDGLCDINCCCDSECSADEITTFSCIPGAFGGDFTTDPFELCGSQRFMLPDWHQFMCIQFLNTPDLGLFQGIDSNIASNAPSFSLRLTENPSTYSFADDAVETPVSPATSYRNGDPVQIVYDQSSVGYLTLPQRFLSGQCLRSSVVAFQNDSNSNCDVTVTSALCASDSILDINTYLTTSSNVVAGPTGSIQPDSVTYFCGNASDYVKTNENTLPTTGRSLFSDSSITPGASICSGIPGTPQLDATSSTCLNSVVKVSYSLQWNETAITSLVVEVTVADVPLTEISSTFGVQPNNVLTQEFSVKFAHETAGSQNTALSGNPGYNFGYPVKSGNVSDLGTVDTSASSQLRIWQPSGSGLCAESSSVTPSFGQDTISGCQLRLALSDFNDEVGCDTLRQLVEDKQRELIGVATRVSRYGNPEALANSSDWLNLNASESLSVASANLTHTPGRCDEIPAQVEIVFLTTLSGRILGFPVMEIVGVNVSWTRLTWQMQCAGTQACAVNDPSLVENFFLMSSVRFISIPVVTPSPPTIFDIFFNMTCEKDATCWPELPLPLTYAFYFTWPLDVARIELEYNLTWTLILILFTSGATLLPLNWSKIGRSVKDTVPL